MADEDLSQATIPPALADLAKLIIAQATDPTNSLGIQTLLQNTHLESAKDIEELGWKLVGTLIAKVAQVIFGVLHGAEPALDDISKEAVNGLFFGGGIRGGQSGDLASTVAPKIIGALTGNAQSIEPSDGPAKEYLNTVTHFAIEGWLQSWIVELVSDVCPRIQELEKFGELKDTVAQVMGLGRLTRRVLGPFMTALVVDPAQWHVSKTYRPKLLAESTALRQFLRGRWDWADVEEELARQGYSSERIDALLNELSKFHSVSDLWLFVETGYRTRDAAIQHLRDAGYDPALADDALKVEELKQTQAFELAMADAAVTAFADGRIDGATLDTFTRGAAISQRHSAQLRELAEAKRQLRATPISSAEARACVKAKILNVIDYRHALEREGRTPDAVLALELLLRHELEAQADVEKIRAELVAQRDAEKKALEAERAKRAADVEAANALHRRGTIADLRAAVVRGLIPIARLEEVLVAMYDRDTVGIYMGLVEDERQAYLAQQERADAARQRAQRGGLNEGQLAAGVLANVLTIDQYRDSLLRAGLVAGDVAVLVATLAAKKKVMDDARTKRLAADAAAARRSIDLSRFEQLVRRGHRTLAEYDALLASLEFDEPSRAAMVELLQLRITDDADARAIRASSGHAVGPRGLTLEQLRAAVIAGNASIDDFQRYLDDAKYTADAQVVLLAELRDDVAAADTARQRRSQTSATSGGAALSLSRLLAAARLGILPPAEYQRRLEAAGYSADDVAIEMDLLLTEMSQVQAARAKQAAVTTSGADKGLTLSEIAHAVKMGVTTIDAYRARAVELGLDAGDVAIVVGVLEQELLVLKDAKSRRTAIAADLVARGVALSDLEQQVIAGGMTVGAYQASLEELGIAAEDADYLGALLAVQLEAADAGVA